jgi:hypothetical protein
MGDRQKDYTIGRGSILFKPDGEDNYTPFGNAPDFKLGMKTENKEHFSSESEVLLKDKDIITKTEGKGSFSLDEPNISNLTKFFMGDAATSANQTAGTVTDEAVTALHDKFVQLSKLEVSDVVVINDAGTTTYVEGTDYVVNKGQGLLMALSTGAITDNQALEVDFDHAVVKTQKGNAGKNARITGHLWFIGNPTVGGKIDIKGFVSLTPNGDMDMIGADWMKMQFNFDFLTHADYTGLFEYSTRGVKA